DGALSGDDLLVIVRRYKDVAVLGRELIRHLDPLITLGSDHDDLCAKRSSGVKLDLGSGVRKDDGGKASDGARSVGHALRVVPAGVRDDAALSLRLGELRDHIVSAAKLEAADGLSALKLEIELVFV